jgi:hypothetical protein
LTPGIPLFDRELVCRARSRDREEEDKKGCPMTPHFDSPGVRHVIGRYQAMTLLGGRSLKIPRVQNMVRLRNNFLV